MERDKLKESLKNLNTSQVITHACTCLSHDLSLTMGLSGWQRLICFASGLPLIKMLTGYICISIRSPMVAEDWWIFSALLAYLTWVTCRTSQCHWLTHKCRVKEPMIILISPFQKFNRNQSKNTTPALRLILPISNSFFEWLWRSISWWQQQPQWGSKIMHQSPPTMVLFMLLNAITAWWTQFYVQWIVIQLICNL